MMALLLMCLLTPLAIAQSGTPQRISNQQYVPRLGDIMNAAQSRHMKLWFAGKLLNWDLAAYELGQLKASLLEAASLYSGIPVTGVTTMAKPVDTVAETIEAKDFKRFAKAFRDLTDGCNACHRSVDRGYVVMRVPEASPFSNQVFAPQGKP
jgi:hypothetical protein